MGPYYQNTPKMLILVMYALIKKQRNAAIAGIFEQHISNGDFPSVESDDLPPEHTIIVEADISNQATHNNNGKTRVSPELRDRIISTCGDTHCVSVQSKKVDPCLRLYVGAHTMCIDNSQLKSTNIGNGISFSCKMYQAEE